MTDDKNPIKDESKPAKSGSSFINAGNKTPIIIGLVVLFLVGGFVIKSLNRSVTDTVLEQVTKKASEAGVNVDSTAGNITINSKDGTTSTFSPNQEIPADFPDVIPLYAGQEIGLTSRTVTPEGIITWSVSAKSNDDVVTIKNLFIAELSGWTQVQDLFLDGIYTGAYTKGNISLLLGVSPNKSRGPQSKISYTAIMQP